MYYNFPLTIRQLLQRSQRCLLLYCSKQDTEALKLLTIDQALEDIKEFMKQMNEKYFKGTNTKWVTFGGSYPGWLCTWLARRRNLIRSLL